MSEPSRDLATTDGAAADTETWIERARAASVNLLVLVERNPHGEFLTGLPVEPWQPTAHPLRPAE